MHLLQPLLDDFAVGFERVVVAVSDLLVAHLDLLLQAADEQLEIHSYEAQNVVSILVLASSCVKFVGHLQKVKGFGYGLNILLGVVAAILLELEEELAGEGVLRLTNEQRVFHQILSVHGLLVAYLYVFRCHVDQELRARATVAGAVNSSEMHFVLDEVGMARVGVYRNIGPLALSIMQPIIFLSLAICLQQLDHDEVVGAHHFLMHLQLADGHCDDVVLCVHCC